MKSTDRFLREVLLEHRILFFRIFRIRTELGMVSWMITNTGFLMPTYFSIMWWLTENVKQEKQQQNQLSQYGGLPHLDRQSLHKQQLVKWRVPFTLQENFFITGRYFRAGCLVWFILWWDEQSFSLMPVIMVIWISLFHNYKFCHSFQPMSDYSPAFALVPQAKK